MTYDARKPGQRDPAAVSFPCPVRFIDPQNGERIANVFWADTAGKLRRFVMDAEGQPMVAADGVSRLELYEIRPWKAVSLASGEPIAQSENAL